VDSCFEVFLEPDTKPTEMLLQPQGFHHGQFIFNASGSRFDRIGTNDPLEWNPEWTVETAISDEGWVAEMALPFTFIGDTAEGLPYEPQDMTVWKCQFVRSASDGSGTERSSAFPLVGEHRNPFCFGPLLFLVETGPEGINKRMDWTNVIAPLLEEVDTHAAALRHAGDTQAAEKLTERRSELAARHESATFQEYEHKGNAAIREAKELADEALAARRQMLAERLRGDGLSMALVPAQAVTDSEKVLPDFLPDAAEFGGTVRVGLCRGEFEPASFVIWTPQPLKKVSVSVGDLSGPPGTLSGDSVDVRWVKCWYQGGVSTISQTGLKLLTPELLLKDPELVGVDLERKRNLYAHKEGEGKPANKEQTVGFYPDDATKLLPLSMLPPFFAQQVWLTLRTPEDAAPGIYKGTIAVTADGVPAATLSLEVEVYDFDLMPSPLQHGVYCFSGGWEKPEDEVAVMEELRNLREHGIDYPGIRCEDPANLAPIIERMRRAGFPTDTVFVLTYGYWVDQYANTISADLATARTKAWTEAADALGIETLYLYLADEAQGERLRVEKRTADIIHGMGAKTWVACYRDYFDIGAEIIDAPVIAGSPVAPKLVDKIHALGNIVLNYANPQCGTELPETYRRNYGLLLWTADYDGSMNFTYREPRGGREDTWDDFDTDHYRDHNMVYPTQTGVVDTIQWEGWREGTDDCRYLGTLLHWVEQARRAGDRDGAAEAAQLAAEWLASLKAGRSRSLQDLEAVRSEMVTHIRRCRDAVIQDE
jgi:hypothetical protein